MTREILFRGYYPVAHRWVYGGYLEFRDTVAIGEKKSSYILKQKKEEDLSIGWLMDLQLDNTAASMTDTANIFITVTRFDSLTHWTEAKGKTQGLCMTKQGENGCLKFSDLSRCKRENGGLNTNTLLQNPSFTNGA